MAKKKCFIFHQFPILESNKFYTFIGAQGNIWKGYQTFKRLFYSLLHKFLYCSVAHIDLIESLRIVGVETTKKQCLRYCPTLKRRIRIKMER